MRKEADDVVKMTTMQLNGFDHRLVSVVKSLIFTMAMLLCGFETKLRVFLYLVAWLQFFCDRKAPC